MLGDMLFETATHDLEQRLKAIDFLLKFTTIAYSEAWLLPFLVNAYSVVTRTPATRGLIPVALHFARLTKFTATVRRQYCVSDDELIEEPYEIFSDRFLFLLGLPFSSVVSPFSSSCSPSLPEAEEFLSSEGSVGEVLAALYVVI